MSSNKKHKKERKYTFKNKIKKFFIHKTISYIEHLNIISFMKKINQSKLGLPWMRRFSNIPYAWPNYKKLYQLAIKLTIEQLEKEGLQPKLSQIKKLINEITHIYDHNIHKLVSTAAATIMDSLFHQEKKKHPFVSKDMRDLKYLKEIKEYRRQGLGVIYLVNHSSHLDEFLIDILTTCFGLELPLFAAGQNMMAMKNLEKIFRVGSYIVQRRGSSHEKLAALFNFCRAISETGGQQAIFLEAWHGGARSRDGSLRYPRQLVTLKGALSSKKEVVIQPLAISYSVIPEDLTLVNNKSSLCWLNGINFWKTFLQIFIHPRSWIWNSIKNLYERAVITMPKPILLSHLKKQHVSDPGGLGLDEYVSLYAIREIARTKKVMSSQLVARGIMRVRRQLNENTNPQITPNLLSAIKYEKKILFEYHKETFNQNPDLEDFIKDSTDQETLTDGLKILKKRKIIAHWRHDVFGLPTIKNESGLLFYATHGDRRIYSPTADQNIVVVGANDWGFVLTSLIGNRILEEKRYLNASLTLYDSRNNIAKKMGITRHPPGRFKQYRLPKNAFVTSDPPSAFRKASEIILASIPEEFPSKIKSVLSNAEQNLRIVIITSGFEPKSQKLPCQILYDMARSMGRNDIEVYSLVGPISEKNLLEKKESFAVLSGPSKNLSELADLFSWPPLKITTSNDDPLGTQASAVLAKIYAFWASIKKRQKQITDPNQMGLFSAESGKEAMQLITSLGGKSETANIGSIAWTSIFIAENLSRKNQEIARKIVNITKKTNNMTIAAKKVIKQASKQNFHLQSYYDLFSTWNLANKANLKLPILNEAYHSLWNK